MKALIVCDSIDTSGSFNIREEKVRAITRTISEIVNGDENIYHIEPLVYEEPPPIEKKKKPWSKRQGKFLNHY
jgi:hypothetical protein